jgi:hypothetical protein
MMDGRLAMRSAGDVERRIMGKCNDSAWGAARAKGMIARERRGSMISRVVV